MLIYVAQSLGGRSGAARLTHDVLSALVSTGRAVTVVTRSTNPMPSVNGARALAAPRNVSFPGAVDGFPRRQARWAVATLEDMPRRFRLARLQPSGVLVHSLEEDALFRRQRWARTPRRALIIHESPRHFSGPEARHDRAWALAAMRSYSDLIFVSSRCREEWLRFPELRGAASRYIPNCAREDEIEKVVRQDRASVRASLGLSADRFVVVTVGTLQPRKGQDIVVKTLGDMRAAIPTLDWYFLGTAIPPSAWFGGSLTWARTLEDEVLRGGHGERVHFCGAREDALAWIYSADALVLPSRAEAQPLTVLEAMALGTPIVASNVDGVPELVIDGDSAELFDPERPVGLVEALVRLSSDAIRRREMAARARERYAAEFSATLFRERYRVAMEQILQS